MFIIEYEKLKKNMRIYYSFLGILVIIGLGFCLKSNFFLMSVFII